MVHIWRRYDFINTWSAFDLSKNLKAVFTVHVASAPGIQHMDGCYCIFSYNNKGRLRGHSISYLYLLKNIYRRPRPCSLPWLNESCTFRHLCYTPRLYIARPKKVSLCLQRRGVGAEIQKVVVQWSWREAQLCYEFLPNTSLRFKL